MFVGSQLGRVELDHQAFLGGAAQIDRANAIDAFQRRHDRGRRQRVQLRGWWCLVSPESPP